MTQAKTKKKQLHRTVTQKARHWFFPNARNNFHPTALRPIGLFVFALVIAFIPTLYNVTSTGHLQVLGYAANVTVGDLHALSNQERTSAGVGALSLNGALSNAAYNKAQDMFAKNYWAHNSPTGATPWTFITSAGYRYSTAGENLAKGFNTSAGVVNGWMNSAGHRANLLKEAYRDVGYAVVNGTLLGEETTLVVAMYGAPYVAPAPAPTPTPPPAPAVTEPAKPAVKETAPVTTPTTSAEQPKETTPTETTPEETPVETPKATEETKMEPTVTKPVEQAASTSPTPAVEGDSTFAPVRSYNAMNWGQKTSLFIISFLALLFVMKHTIVWRSSKRGLKNIWLRSHPIAQGGILFLAILVTFLSGTGSIL